MLCIFCFQLFNIFISYIFVFFFSFHFEFDFVSQLAFYLRFYWRQPDQLSIKTSSTHISSYAQL